MSPNLPQRQYTVNYTSESFARTTAGDAFTTFVVRVFQLNGRLLEAGDALAKPAGQTSARWQVMAAIEDTPATVAQIARALSLTRQSVQRVADLLASDELAAYEENPAHRRAMLLRLTVRGRSVLNAIQTAQRPWANALGALAGEAEIRQATVLIERIIELSGS